MNDKERELWVRNDETLYMLWLASQKSMRNYIRSEREYVDGYIQRTLARADAEAKKLS